jgi:hypothetical protein
LAVWVIAWPLAETSSPAPAVVWQAPSTGARPIRARRVKAIERFLYMMIVPLCISSGFEKMGARDGVPGSAPGRRR